MYVHTTVVHEYNHHNIRTYSRIQNHYRPIVPSCCCTYIHTHVRTHVCMQVYAVSTTFLAGLSTSCGRPFTWRRSCCHPLCADKDAREGGCPSLEELWVLHARLCVQVSIRMQQQKTMAMYVLYYYYTVHAGTVLLGNIHVGYSVEEVSLYK